MSISNSTLKNKLRYEQFTRSAIRSDYFAELTKNNKLYWHVLRFICHVVLFATFIAVIKLCFSSSPILGVLVLPFYVHFQGLLIAGFMIHSHELSHNHIKIKWLNNTIGILSGFVSFINFYSFQHAHRFHHQNIGNLDTPEAGAPISLTGQKNIRHDDRLQKIMGKLLQFSPSLLFLLSWPLFILYGDYSSWLLPYRTKGRVDRASLLCFVVFTIVNSTLLIMIPTQHIFLYLLPVLFGGNRILAITYMHHAHEDSVFFSKEHHNFYNSIMSTTDRDFGKVVNFFMMNNGYHIPHHMNPRIAYYDLKKASEYLRKTIPEDLSYNFYKKSRFYNSLKHNTYEQRLDRDYDFYQLTFSNSGAQS